MIFFKFNLISFTVTILAILIIPAYSNIDYLENCQYVLIDYAGFHDNLAQDRKNLNYTATMEKARNEIKATAEIKIESIYINLDIKDYNVAQIITNLIDGYKASLYLRLRDHAKRTVEKYCGHICGTDIDITRDNFTTILHKPLAYD